MIIQVIRYLFDSAGRLEGMDGYNESGQHVRSERSRRDTEGRLVETLHVWADTPDGITDGEFSERRRYEEYKYGRYTRKVYENARQEQGREIWRSRHSSSTSGAITSRVRLMAQERIRSMTSPRNESNILMTAGRRIVLSRHSRQADAILALPVTARDASIEMYHGNKRRASNSLGALRGVGRILSAFKNLDGLNIELRCVYEMPGRLVCRSTSLDGIWFHHRTWFVLL